MDRREALKQLALLTGGALSLSTVSGFLGGCSAGSKEEFTPQTLSTSQNRLVIELTERIIPATDTPGAKEAKVNQYIDHMLTNWNTKEERDFFLSGLEYVNTLSNGKYSQDFVDLNKEQKISVLKILENEALELPNPQPDSDIKPFFSMLKEFTIVGYYTSEIGASEELNSDLIPGYYDPCMPYSEVGRAWS